ncbi:MAG: ATP-binding cassette domain-containing protein [Actinomycetota bacterium]|nr:ATP-binding cassette domain-containing protein [Actinomycetota bacterium]
MLNARRISKSYGSAVVLTEVDVSVGPRSRLGLVGPNGIGKSTLLRILAGLEAPDEGRVERSPTTLEVGWLPQEVQATQGETLQDYLARRTGVAEAERDLEHWTSLLATDPTDAIEPYTEALERFMTLGGDDLAARAGEVCADVGLPDDRLGVPLADLSGGQQARAALAAILLARFDVFLLDEPTNNLDFAGLDRLERFLDGLAGGVIVVSHDRAFLDRTATRILELQEESHRAVEYAGGWSDYVEQRELSRSQQYEAFDKFKAEKGRLTERIKEQRQWAVSGVNKEKKKGDGDKMARDFRVNRTEKQASKVRISEKALANLTEVDKPWEGWRLQLQFAPEARSGDVVARLDGAVVQRGSFTLGPIDLEIGWQERLAIVGPNGGGKTTLLKTLLGELDLASGNRFVGPGVKIGTMDQARELFGGDQKVLATFMTAAGVAELSEARSLLAKFGLSAEHVERSGGRLSPGERSRATLATLMASGVNCLVLDEPTNHLDLAAIEELERALEGYDGTLLLVTHDRRLLEAVALTRTVLVEAGRIDGSLRR